MIVRLAPLEHYAWIASRAKLTVSSEFRAVEAVDGERIVGMVGFDGWTPNAVCMHIALDSPIALRRLVTYAFGIAFLQCKRFVALCTVLGNNERSLDLVRHLGFRELGRVRHGWSHGVDLVSFEMRRNECRFLPRGNRLKEAA